MLKEGDDVYFTCHVDANPPPTIITWYHESSGGWLATLMTQIGGRNFGSTGGCGQIDGHTVGSTGGCGQMGGHWATVGRSGTQWATVGRSGPQWTAVGHSGHHWATVGRRGSQLTSVGRSGPQWTSLGHSRPQWTSVSHSEPQWTSLGHSGPPSGERDVSSSMSVVSALTTCCCQPTETPLPLSSCRLANITASWLSLTCHQRPERYRSPGTILYRAEVYFENHTLFANVTSVLPSFTVSQLDADTSYRIKVYVSQGPVTSPPVVVSAYTSRTSVRGGGGRTRASKVGGCVGGIIVVVVMMGGVVWARRNCWRHTRSQHKLGARPSPDDHNPDVVPNIADDDTHDLLCLTEGKSENSSHQVLDNPAHHLTPLVSPHDTRTTQPIT
ncbi:uncharacterized protein [Panulirus ornatus]|uniref:uncharacterized protein n=1 Tax=Panulirus ornatus TaxID=150431 RepID=UPI003A843D5F